MEYLEIVPTLAEGRDAPTYERILGAYRPPQEQRSLACDLSRFLGDLDRSLSAMQCLRPEDQRDRVTPAFVAKMLHQYLLDLCMAGLRPKEHILVFAPTISFANECAEHLRGSGYESCRAVHSKEAKTEEYMRQFMEGSIQILIGVDMLSEGFDLPNLDTLVLARATDSEIVFVQQMGRALRRDASNPSKEVAILDMALNLRRRWRRLREELPDEDLAELVLSFWEVQNYVGTSSSQLS